MILTRSTSLDSAILCLGDSSASAYHGRCRVLCDCSAWVLISNASLPYQRLRYDLPGPLLTIVLYCVTVAKIVLPGPLSVLVNVVEYVGRAGARGVEEQLAVYVTFQPGSVRVLVSYAVVVWTPAGAVRTLVTVAPVAVEPLYEVTTTVSAGVVAQ